MLEIFFKIIFKWVFKKIILVDYLYWLFVFSFFSFFGLFLGFGASLALLKFHKRLMVLPQAMHYPSMQSKLYLNHFQMDHVL